MNVVTTLPATVASLVIALTVVLSGIHAKDFVTTTLPPLLTDTKKQAEDTSQHAVKVVAELHNHVDKTKLQTTDAGHQADNRSLRLLHENKKESAFRNKLSDRLRLWWQLSSLSLG